MEDDPPLEINPYAVLEIESSATAAEVKSAYKKLALRNHPDKVAHNERDDAHSKFQKIAFAYAILSDDRRRKRYDTTGNTAETLNIDDDDFNWLDFFRAQWADTVTCEKISDFAGKYKGSDEEKQDVLNAFERFNGDLNKLFKDVMLSNVLDDEERFRAIIDEAIKVGDAEAYEAYVNESDKKRKARRKQAQRDAAEAAKHAEDLGLNGHKKAAAMIQQRQKGRAATFLDDLEAKYAAPKAKKGKKRPLEQPPEEAFQEMGARVKKQKKPRIEEENDEDDVDLNGDDFDDDDDDDDEEEEGEEEEEEEEAIKPSKSRKKQTSKASKQKSRGSRKKV